MSWKTQFKLCLTLMVVLAWIGCGGPQVDPNNPSPQDPIQVIAEASKGHSSPEPATGASPPERPDDKPNDPQLFDHGTGIHWVGDPCTQDSDCDFADAYCMKDSTGFPGGYCMKSCTKYCPDRSGKPFTLCVKRGSGGACFSRCDTSLFPGTGCRSGYECRDEARIGETSNKKGVCVPNPNATPTPPPTPTGNKFIGEACTQNADCAYEGGTCQLESTGFPGGSCAKACTQYCPDQDGKPSTFCAARGSGGLCFSRCDVGAFPGTGCRTGYKCQEEARLGQSWIKRGICVPDAGGSTQPPPPPPTPPDPPTSGGDLPVTPGISCYDQLTKWGVKYTKTSNPNTQLAGASRRCSIDSPIRLEPPILGVDYVIWTKQRITMLVGCQTGLRIARLSHYLKNRGLTKVMHLGTYNCRKIANSSSLSNHSFGGAIDLASFFSANGTEYDTTKHWDHSTTWTKNGNMGCWSSRFNSPQAKVLYEIGCDMWKQKIFSLVLTPNYNRAHDNHFHVDLTSSGKVLSDDVGYIGQYDDEH